MKDFELGASTSSQIRLGIEKTFREANIEIAFPQLDVHVKDLPPRVCSNRPATPSAGRRARPRPVRRPPGTGTAGTKAAATSADTQAKVDADDSAATSAEDKSQTA